MLQLCLLTKLLIQGRSYKALTPRARALLGVGLMINAGLALHFSEQVEETLVLKPTPEEERKFKDGLPKFSTVERSK